MENKITRKMRKPLMEKKRRARINQSLDELYQILADTDFITQGTKLEKADILQMTVQYIKNLKSNIYCCESKENYENLMREKYFLGFEKSIEEINFLLMEITKINPCLTKSISLFLKHFLNKIKKEPRIFPLTGQQLLHENREKHLRSCKIKCRGKENCSEMFRKYEKLKIISSTLCEEESFLLQSKTDKRKKNLNEGNMWRPWW